MTTRQNSITEKVIQDQVTVNATALSQLETPRPFLCTYFSDNTVDTLLTQNTWAKFATPTTGYITPMNNGSLFSVNNNNTYTYTGTDPIFCELSAVANFRGSGNNKDIEFQWRLNGTPIGFIRSSTFHTNDANIIAGTSCLGLSNGDQLEPFTRNVENNDDLLVLNMSITIKAESLFYKP